MNTTLLGLVAGLALGFAAAFGGFGAFLIVLLFGAIGLGIGAYLGGRLNLPGLTGRDADRIHR